MICDLPMKTGESTSAVLRSHYVPKHSRYIIGYKLDGETSYLTLSQCQIRKAFLKSTYFVHAVIEQTHFFDPHVADMISYTNSQTKMGDHEFTFQTGDTKFMQLTKSVSITMTQCSAR
jgi:hypothetical protein